MKKYVSQKQYETNGLQASVYMCRYGHQKMADKCTTVRALGFNEVFQSRTALRDDLYSDVGCWKELGGAHKSPTAL